MSFFPEVDVDKTKKNAKRKLREYARWREIAGSCDEQQVTAHLTFVPKGNRSSPSRPVERIAINKVDAELEVAAIEEAVNRIVKVEFRKILIDKFLSVYPKSDTAIHMELGYERSRYFDFVGSALLSFASLYRDGVLVVYSKSD